MTHFQIKIRQETVTTLAPKAVTKRITAFWDVMLWSQCRHLLTCTIWGFHGGDYEECRLLGYKNPVRTSQETQYVSATETSQLMLCKIWGFHGGNYEELPSSRMLRCLVLVRTDVSKEHSVYIIRLTRMDELGTMLTVTSNQRKATKSLRVSSQRVPVASYS
jgi:hypothetical protein